MSPLRATVVSIAGVLLASAGLADAPPPALTGKDLDLAISTALAQNGISGTAIIAHERRYYPCDVPVQVQPRREGRWDAVEVICTAPLPWDVIIRTTASSAVELSGSDGENGQPVSAIVLKHSIRKGEILSEDRLELIEFTRAPAPGTFQDVSALVGRTMAQGLGAGIPLRERHLEIDYAIHKGDPVTLEIDVGGITVSTAGVALMDGQIGELLEIENIKSGKSVRGILTSEKKVLVRANMN